MQALPTPWRDRDGTVSPVRAFLLLALAAPAVALALTWALAGLGPRPFTVAIHETGLWSMRLLLVALLVTPVRQVLRLPQLVPLRRMIGVAAFAYAVVHVILYLADLKWDMAKLLSEMLLRAYLTVGLIATLMMAALAATSFDGMVRRLGGRAWRALHRLAYPAMALAVVHFLMHSKLDVVEAALMGGGFAWAMLYRAVAPKGAAPSLPVLILLAPAAAVVTAAGEALWIGTFTGLSGWAILQANLDVAFGLRPALWVGLAALLAPALRLTVASRGRGYRSNVAVASR